MKCPKCGSSHILKNGKRGDKQNHICADCGRQFINNYSVLGYSQDVKKICLKMYCNGMGFRPDGVTKGRKSTCRGDFEGLG
jgi:transposase-like protein